MFLLSKLFLSTLNDMACQVVWAAIQGRTWFKQIFYKLKRFVHSKANEGKIQSYLLINRTSYIKNHGMCRSSKSPYKAPWVRNEKNVQIAYIEFHIILSLNGTISCSLLQTYVIIATIYFVNLKLKFHLRAKVGMAQSDWIESCHD